jgi:hypothetical protein
MHLLRNRSKQPCGSNYLRNLLVVADVIAGTFDEQEQKRWLRRRHKAVALGPRIPKLDPNMPTNTKKEPDEWVSGDDPMTGAQASYLKTLSEEARDPDAYDENLTKAEASKRIDALKEQLGIQ